MEYLAVSLYIQYRYLFSTEKIKKILKRGIKNLSYPHDKQR